MVLMMVMMVMIVMATMVLRIFSVQWGESMMTFQGRVHVLSSLHVSPSWQSKNTPCHPLFYPYIKNNKKIMTSIFTINSVQFSRLLIPRCSNLIYWESGSLRWLFLQTVSFFTNNSSQLSDFLFIILANNYFVFCQTFGALVTISAATHCFQVSPVSFFFWRRAPLFLFTLPKTFSTLSMATFRKGVWE